jgi:hypothetical protein
MSRLFGTSEEWNDEVRERASTEGKVGGRSVEFSGR